MLVWNNTPSPHKVIYRLPLVSYRSAQVASFGLVFISSVKLEMVVIGHPFLKRAFTCAYKTIHEWRGNPKVNYNRLQSIQVMQHLGKPLVDLIGSPTCFPYSGEMNIVHWVSSVGGINFGPSPNYRLAIACCLDPQQLQLHPMSLTDTLVVVATNPKWWLPLAMGFGLHAQQDVILYSLCFLLVLEYFDFKMTLKTPN